MKAAAYCATRNLYPHLVPAIKSLLMHSGVEKIYLLIEDDEFPEWLPEECVTINASKQKYFPKTGVNYDSVFSYMAAMKIVLCEYLPKDLDRVLVLDVDTIVDQNIDELWEIPLDGYWFAGVADRGPTIDLDVPLYINNGVTVQNLKEIRKSAIWRKLVKAINTEKFFLFEQDILNKYSQGHILELPSKFNYFWCQDPCEWPAIIHHAGQRNSSLPGFTDVKKYADKTWGEVLERRHGGKG